MKNQSRIWERIKTKNKQITIPFTHVLHILSAGELSVPTARSYHDSLKQNQETADLNLNKWAQMPLEQVEKHLTQAFQHNPHQTSIRVLNEQFVNFIDQEPQQGGEEHQQQQQQQHQQSKQQSPEHAQQPQQNHRQSLHHVYNQFASDQQKSIIDTLEKMKGSLDNVDREDPQLALAIQELLQVKEDFLHEEKQDQVFMSAKKDLARQQEVLEKRLRQIYDTYRKEMHVNGETFSKNADLSMNMDLRVFLKYYKDFEIGAKYSRNQATNLFKKHAVNQRWLHFEDFVHLHHQLGETQQDWSIPQKINKIKELKTVVSTQKVKVMLNVHTETSKVKAIVAMHSGNFQEDMLKRLKEKEIQREKQKEQLQKQKGKKLKTQSNQNQKSYMRDIKRVASEPKLQINRKKVPIDRQFSLPKISRKKLQKESIYTQLNQADIYNEKLKLKEWIGGENGEQEIYLRQYLKRQQIAKYGMKQHQMRKPKLRQLDVEQPRMRFT